ncbi:MAG: hypothetical protein P8186_17180 [Anaerolineae bacterium]
MTVLQDHELQAALSRNGRELVKAKYDWNVIGQQYEAILNKLANGRR